MSNFLQLVGVSLIGTVLPIYLIQQGIKYSEPIVVTFAFTIEPLVMFLIQIADSRLTVSYSSLWGITIAVGFSVVGIYGR